MDEATVEKLTRLAQSMPVKGTLHMERTHGARGEIYMAFGEGDGSIHGCYGYFGLCRAIDFEPDTTKEQIRQVLYKDATEEVEKQVEAGVLK
jgi:hypothetical protein